MPIDTLSVKRGPGYREFIALMAVMISITALPYQWILCYQRCLPGNIAVHHADGPFSRSYLSNGRSFSPMATDALLLHGVLLPWHTLFGNLNAIAMEPLGHIAGVGAAVVGSLSNLISVPLAIIIGRYYNGTTLPLICGFVTLSIFTVVAMRWADTSRQSENVRSHPPIIK